MKYKDIKSEILNLEKITFSSIYNSRKEKNFYNRDKLFHDICAKWSDVFNDLYQYRNNKLDFNRDPLYRKLELIRDKFVNIKNGGR